MTSQQTTYERILGYIETIQKKPKKDVKFFYFDEGQKFIVDGNKLKLLPLEFHKLYAKDEFYVHVNARERKVMYYAFDISNYVDGEHVEEEEGFMEWKKDIEDCIYNFFVLNIKDLTESTYPHNEVVKNTPVTGSGYNGGHQTAYHGRGEHAGSSWSGYSNYGNQNYSSGPWKEREEFYDKIWAALKSNRTSKATDIISDHVTKLCADKKFDDLDTIMRMIAFEKLNIPSMITLLSATRGADHLLRERKYFYDKVKTHITKLKPSRVDMLIGKLEPGKEYKDVVKYEK